ncbi:transposase [Pedobacter sp. UBA4863]|uniref:transposase n=2 Tax=Pedobacter TaxID=84567 RepID=UPI0039C8F601
MSAPSFLAKASSYFCWSCACVSKAKLDESIHKPLYDRMHQKLTDNKAYHRRLVKRRSSTVEPVLGTLINHHNMKRINSRGMAQANKHVLMAALSYNLKKLLKFTRKNPTIIAQSMPSIKGVLFWFEIAIGSVKISRLELR